MGRKFNKSPLNHQILLQGGGGLLIAKRRVQNAERGVADRQITIFPAPDSPPSPLMRSNWYTCHGKYPPDGCGHVVQLACCLCRLCETRRISRNLGLLQVDTGELDHAEAHTGECPDVD